MRSSPETPETRKLRAIINRLTKRLATSNAKIDQVTSDLDTRLSNVEEGSGEAGASPVFAIWAEENAALGTNLYEWAFGNGADVPNGQGVVVPACELFAVGLSLRQGSASVRVKHNGTTVATIDSVSDGNFLALVTPVAATQGTVVGFQTSTAAGTAAPNIVTAWYRIP